MDSIILATTLFNFVVLFALFGGIYAHFADSWTHNSRGFVVLATASIFLAEAGLMALSLEAGLFLLLCVSTALATSITMTFRFGYELLVSPWRKRLAKNPRVRLVVRQLKARRRSLGHTIPHLSSR